MRETRPSTEELDMRSGHLARLASSPECGKEQSGMYVVAFEPSWAGVPLCSGKRRPPKGNTVFPEIYTGSSSVLSKSMPTWNLRM